MECVTKRLTTTMSVCLFMLAAGVLTYGALALAGAALVKYLFFTDRGHAAG